MGNIKILAKDTAIYGLSSIVGRFLNYMLVPLYTHCMPKDSGDYGVSVNIYAYVALILVILTFGMETTLFRFANKPEYKPDTVFSTSMAVVASLCALFLGGLFLGITPIADFLGYNSHPEYLLIMGTVVTLDALQAIPFCYLRFQKRAIRFASLKVLFILLNIAFNLVCFLWLGYTQVIWVFLINLCCTLLITLFFIPDLLRIHWQVDVRMLREMLRYSWPILILGIAGILNQAADKMIFPLVYPDKTEADIQLGIYGACVKVAMIMAMITQAFRYAYEPLVFAQSQEKGHNEYYAVTMKYFLVFTLMAYLFVIAYMPILQYIIGADYRSGLKAVPVVMAAEIMMGIYFNLSFWYKLIDRTIYGAWFSLAGCGTLLLINILFIPRYGYMACAWAGVGGYGVAMLLSYFVGYKMNPVRYPLTDMLRYTLLAAVLTALMLAVTEEWPTAFRLAANTLFMLLFLAYTVYKEIPVQQVKDKLLKRLR